MSDTVQSVIILLPVLLVSMSIHELMHALAADRLGDPTSRLMGRISFNPLRHIDPFFTVALPLLLIISHSSFLFGAAKPVQVNFNRLKYDEFGGAIVGAIGPLTNLVIAILAGLIFQAVDPTFGTVLYEVFRVTIMLNIGLFVFNMIPWPPLDGSRVLYAFAPKPLQEFMESIERFGLMGLVLFIFVIYQFISPVVGNVATSLVDLIAPGLII
jgi:Zn-dependent protease